MLYPTTKYHLRVYRAHILKDQALAIFSDRNLGLRAPHSRSEQNCRCVALSHLSRAHVLCSFCGWHHQQWKERAAKLGPEIKSKIPTIAQSQLSQSFKDVAYPSLQLICPSLLESRFSHCSYKGRKHVFRTFRCILGRKWQGAEAKSTSEFKRSATDS